MSWLSNRKDSMLESRYSVVCRSAMAACLVVVMASDLALAAAETKEVKAQLLELTGGRRAKVVWNQGEKDGVPLIQYYDTRDGATCELPFAGQQAWLTPDGRKIVAWTGKTDADHALLMYDTESKSVTKLASGPECYPVAVWTDPKTRRDWVYVNDCGAGGDRQRSWDAGRDKLYRFPIDAPQARELFWDRTTSHEFLMFSADGTHACFAPTFNNIGQLKLAFDAQGKVDQDKCTFKPVGHGCFPGMAPDDSYRLFRLDGDHHTITMFDRDATHPRKIKVSGMPGVADKGRNTWLTRWSAHPRYLTLVAPAGTDAHIWMGRFDAKFTAVEAWVQVSADGPQCWKSHSWVEPDPQAGTGDK
jgi:hypothetical protein